ncbi:hypothetical protein O181_068315, partial [Austropuccinia psidii MF-1]|nr:hypothetical protein [Austropuccinia psidii MF-1]
APYDAFKRGYEQIKVKASEPFQPTPILRALFAPYYLWIRTIFLSFTTTSPNLKVDFQRIPNMPVSIPDELNKVLSFESLFGVSGLVAVVTGGGTGIGLMCTEALASHGAKVYITGRRLEALHRVVDKYQPHAKGKIIAIQGDITSKADLERIAQEIGQKEPSGIQILINNAGILGTGTNCSDKEKSVEEFCGEALRNESFDIWDSVWRTNVSGIYFTTINFLPLLQRGSNNQRGYRSGVINITSISGFIKISQSHFGYNASKAAAIHLTKMMGTELGRFNVRFNSIAPGFFPSEMTSGDKSNELGKSDISQTFDAAAHKVPADRAGNLEEMAATVLYLCGKGGQYCDGLVMHVDGGILLTNPATI